MPMRGRHGCGTDQERYEASFVCPASASARTFLARGVRIGVETVGLVSGADVDGGRRPARPASLCQSFLDIGVGPVVETQQRRLGSTQTSSSRDRMVRATGRGDYWR